MAQTKKKIKNPGGAPDQIVIQKIEIRPPNRTEQDIPNWRRSVQNAESQIPRRNKLYSLYFDVDLDGHVEAVTGKRKDPVLAANWQFVDKDGAPHEEINNLIDSLGFSDMLSEIINTRFWGYTMLEPKFWKDEGGEWEMDSGLIPRLNYRPEIGVVAFDIYGNDGINIREGIYAKTVMEVGNVKDLGLYMKAAPYQILKRGGLGDYANFIQVFGHPIIDATWDGFDEKQRSDLQTALNNIGAGGSIIRPDGTSVEIKENNTTASGDAQDKFLSFLNKEISKALLGTTETTESSTSSGYAQSATHLENDERKHENDLNYVRRVLNSRLRPILRAHGFDTLEGKFVIQGEDNELTKAESFAIHKGLKTELGVPIDDDFFYETYNIPKPENYDALKREKQSLLDNTNEKEEEPKEEEKELTNSPINTKEKEVELLEAENKVIKLFHRFVSFFGKAPAPQKEVTGAMVETCGCHHTIKLSDSNSFDDDTLINRIWLAEGKNKFDALLFWHTSDTLIRGFKQGWDDGNKLDLVDAPGFVYGADDPMLFTAYESNLFSFASKKTLAEVQMLNQLFRESKNFKEFYQKAKDKTKIFNRNWLETEYTTAVLTGTAAVNYHRLKKQSEFLPYWKYTTVGDERVRASHQLLDGVIMHHSDERWGKIFPPNGWRCRCKVVALSESSVSKKDIEESKKITSVYLGSAQHAKEKQQGWGINRATAQQVFTANQQYISSLKNEAQLNKLQGADYGLKPYNEILENTSLMKTPIYQGSKDAFYKGLEKREDHRVLADYHNRPIVVLQKDFYSHVTDSKKKRAHRLDYLEALKETLKGPDEVWINSKKGVNKQMELRNYNYIKYYKGLALIVNLELHQGELLLKTWYPLADKVSVINDKRRGLLILHK